jgi:hypothetical protein
MSVIWGNPDEHNRAFREALEEFYRQNPEEHRRFHEMGYELQRLILARQVEIYKEFEAAARVA